MIFNTIKGSENDQQLKSDMKIIEEIKQQVEQEMIKLKIVRPVLERLPLNENQKKKLIELMNEGILLKNAAKQLDVNYHDAKIAYNEYKRKNNYQSDTQSQGEIQKVAGIKETNREPQHFVLQTMINQNIVSVKRLYNKIIFC